MCGIAGILTKNSSYLHEGRLKAMTDSIEHRGPDGEGHWISSHHKVGLGHRRLSIIDLSHEADQPMHYLNRYHLVFNGEIYNYIELRETLIGQGYTFKTQSDTEVLMALYDRHREQCLGLLDGMFALVIYDEKEETVFIARDRFGEKPFFYSYKEGEYFLFGSEMKSLWAGGIKKEVNERMLFNYLSYGYIENPTDLSETFYMKCLRLEHSHYLVIKLDELVVRKQKYYRIHTDQIQANISEDQAIQQFSDLFHTSVKRRLRSDVAVGSSLSGGLDSSLIVCIMDEIIRGTDQIQNTFSAVFPGFKKDERAFMEEVIRKTKVRPHFVQPNEEGFVADLSDLNYHQEEPYGSASIYAQYCVMKLAHENNTTVLLDGQGADEILAGYHHYFPSYFHELKSQENGLFEHQWNAYTQMHSTNAINGITEKGLGDKIRQISPALVKPMKRIRLKYKQWTSPEFNKEFFRHHQQEVFETRGNTFITLNQALYNNTMQSGLQQLLRYADRNSMAHSREVRLPFLYHELVEFLYTLPPHFKIRDGWTKWIMRMSFPILPDPIRWRKDKIGYEPPQKNWMENNTLKERIRANQTNLVKKHICSPGILDKVITPTNAMDADNMSWKHLMAGELYE